MVYAQKLPSILSFYHVKSRFFCKGWLYKSNLFKVITCKEREQRSKILEDSWTLISTSWSRHILLAKKMEFEFFIFWTSSTHKISYSLHLHYKFSFFNMYDSTIIPRDPITFINALILENFLFLFPLSWVGLLPLFFSSFF